MMLAGVPWERPADTSRKGQAQLPTQPPREQVAARPLHVPEALVLVNPAPASLREAAHAAGLCVSSIGSEGRRLVGEDLVSCLHRTGSLASPRPSQCFYDLVFFFTYKITINEIGCETACSVAQLCPTLCSPMDCSPPGSSVHEILQARVLTWEAISFSRASSQPRDQTRVSPIVGRFFAI